MTTSHHRLVVSHVFTEGLLVVALDFDATAELLVLVADELDHLLIRRDALIDAYGERLRVRLRIFDRDVHLQVAVRWTADAVRELRLLGVRAAVHIEPAVARAVFRST